METTGNAPAATGGAETRAYRRVSSTNQSSRRQLDEIKRLIERAIPADGSRRDDRIIRLSAYCLRLLESRATNATDAHAPSDKEPEQIANSIKRRVERIHPEDPALITRTSELMARIALLSQGQGSSRDHSKMMQLLLALAETGETCKSGRESPVKGFHNRARSALSLGNNGLPTESAFANAKDFNRRVASAAVPDSRSDDKQTRETSSSRVVKPRDASPPQQTEAQVFSELTDVPIRTFLPGSVKISKAELLRRWQAESGAPTLSDGQLLRDMVFMSQGVNGQHVRWDLYGRGVIVNPKLKLSRPTLDMIHYLSETGHLYLRVYNFIEQRQHSPSRGLIDQTLCAALSDEMTAYYGLIARLEAALPTEGQAMVMSSQAIPELQSSESIGQEGPLTLKRFLNATEDSRLRLRVLATITDQCATKSLRGGSILSLLHSYVDHGDHVVRDVASTLLPKSSKPFYQTLRRWIQQGELSDPLDEFFVCLNPGFVAIDRAAKNRDGVGALYGGIGEIGEFGEDNDHVDGLRLWEDQYELKSERVPSFIGKSLARKIFSIGRSLSYMRNVCGEADWVTERSRSAFVIEQDTIGDLEASIDVAFSITSKRLFEVFFDRYKLMQHLGAVKRYLLLQQGDFAESLMDALGPSLKKPASQLYRHHLSSTLETAIRGSNAQNDSEDVLRRLDARLLEYQPGDTGWDVFSLDYRVTAPVNAILNATTIQDYLRMFNHLWQLKRLDHVLTLSWRRLTTGSRSLFKARKERLPSGIDLDLHHIRTSLTEMIHFVNQMQYFIQFEVVECAWQSFLEFAEKRTGDLDALIEAHRSFVKRIMTKGMLSSHRRGHEDSIHLQCRETFSHILQFTVSLDAFYSHVLTQGNMPAKGMDTSFAPRFEEALHPVRQRLSAAVEAFREGLQRILNALAVHPDLDLRFLSARLNFNEYYEITGRRREPVVK